MNCGENWYFEIQNSTFWIFDRVEIPEESEGFLSFVEENNMLQILGYRTRD